MFKNFEIKLINKVSKTTSHGKFIIKNHYSKSLSRGNKYSYALYVSGKLRGMAVFGIPTGKKSPGDLECKRFCLAPRAKKNTASWFMAKCLKDIKKSSKATSVVSYADPEQGHEGTMYKASNFQYLGTQKTKGQAILLNGKKIHLRAAYQKINGVHTKTASAVQNGLKNGTARYISLAKKHIFRYNLK